MRKILIRGSRTWIPDICMTFVIKNFRRGVVCTININIMFDNLMT